MTPSGAGRGTRTRLALVAATGGIGRHALVQARAAGHHVTAVVRDPSRLPGPVDAVTVDLADPDPGALERAFDRADAVLSGLGPRSRVDGPITSRGTRAVLRAMRSTGVRRIVVVSAAPVGTVASPGRPHPPRHDPGDGFVMKHLLSPVIKAALRAHYSDLALMEDDLRKSDLDWTVVRPPRLTDEPLTGSYRTAYGRNVRGGLVVPRADVAHLMLDVLHRPDTIGQVLGVAT